jgi:MFS family permease
MTGLAFVFIFRPNQVDLLIFLLFLVAIINGIFQAFFGPSILSAIPELVPRQKIPAANSLNQFSFQFSRILGQSTGGILYGLLGAPLLFLIDGLTFLFSSFSESFIQIKSASRKRSESIGHAIRELNHEMGQGLKYVWHWKGMRNFLIMVGVVHFFAMPFIVLMPFMVELYLGQGSVWYGFLMAGFSAGSVLGYIAAGTLRIGPAWRSSVLLASLCATGLGFGVLGFTTNPYAALVTIFLAGSFLGIFTINVTTILQTSSTDQTRGRVMGLFMTISNAASPLGMLAGGIAGDLTGKNIPLIYAVCSLSIVATVFLIGARKSVLGFLANEGKQ